jgi:hypothetical protein
MAKDDAAAQSIAAELRQAITEHLENFRRRVRGLPVSNTSQNDPPHNDSPQNDPPQNDPPMNQALANRG